MEHPSALFYDDIAPGTEVVSLGRTVSEADVLLFAGLSGDYNPLHMDAEFATGTPHGQRIAHGLLGAAISSGLFTRTAFSLAMQASLIAMLGSEIRFTAPVFLGDTVHVVVTVVEKRPTRNDARGIVVLDRALVNQRGETTQVMRTPMLLARRGDA